MTTNDKAAHPHAAAVAGVKEWHRIVAELDWERLPNLLAEDVVFRNPASFEPYHGKAAMVAILRAVFSVLQDFKYLRHFTSATGYVLEFSARVNAERLFGIDLIEFDQFGKITDLMVMMRPLGAVQLVATEAGKRLGANHAPGEWPSVSSPAGDERRLPDSRGRSVTRP